MTIYDRTVARMSRRELMKLGCLLGVAALIVGLLVSVPITMLAAAHAYRTLTS